MLAMRSPHPSSQPTSQGSPRPVTDTDALSQLVAGGTAEVTGHQSDNNAGQEESNVKKAAESYGSLEKEPTSEEEESSMHQVSDSDYVPSQEPGTSVTEQPKSEKDKDNEEADGGEVVEEHVDLEYQIPEDTLRAAMLASPNTRASFWSPKMYRGPDGQSLSTHYCRSKDVAERVAQHFLKERVVGFDIEWRPFSSIYNIKQNASVIQLACEDRIALFHISLFTGTTPEELMPPTLKTILETPEIYKVGVAVKNDFTRLQKYLNVEPKGVFELSRLHNTIEWHGTDAKKQASNKLRGLAAQVLQHLQLPLYKGAQLQDDPEDTANVRESDWSKPLDLQQIHYAAADAYAGFRLYHILEWKRKQLRPVMPTRGICDYDAKAIPRERKPKKVASKKSKVTGEVVANESTSGLDQDQAQLKENDEEGTETNEVDEDESEDFETAPEEIESSQESEDSAPLSSTKRRAAAASNSNIIGKEPLTRKRIGRVQLPWVKGSDPGYPILPKLPEGLDASTYANTMDNSTDPVENTKDVTRASDTRSPRSDKELDEFADPELEEALRVLDLNGDGMLTESFNSTTTATEEDKHDFVASEPVVLSPTSQTADVLHETDFGSSTNQDIGEDVEITSSYAIGFEPEELEEPCTTSPTTAASLPVTADDPLRSTRYNSASTWAQDYLQSSVPSPKSTTPSRIRATVPHLRAYHLWYHQNLSLDNVASELRDPPLSHSTVAGYILQAVAYEKLAYNNDKMRDMVTGLPMGMRQGRFKRIVEQLGVSK
jgi:hypothetical protein